VEDDLNSLNQQNMYSSTLVESETILKRWKTASIEDNININSASSSQVKPELGTAQPQLFLLFFHVFFITG
jgi:hypothetical protein